MSAGSSSVGEPSTVSPHPRESLFRAATALQKALDKDRSDPTWRAGLRLSLGECVVAVEQHLVALVAPDGVEAEIVEREPRLVPALEQLAIALSQLMVHLWETREDVGHPGPVVTRRLYRLVEEIRDIAAEEFMLVVESFNPTGSVD
jgi:hypothetical protein